MKSLSVDLNLYTHILPALIKSHGFTLLEVLISLSLLAVMLMGLEMMDIASQREIESNYYFFIATQQIQNMAEQLRHLPASTNYAIPLAEWNKENTDLLPQGRGEVTGNYPFFTLKILWGETKLASTNHHQGNSGCIIQNVVGLLS